MGLELEQRRGHREAVLPRGHARDALPLADRVGKILALVLAQQGLVVEQIDLRWRARLEHVDDALRPRREVRKFRESLCAAGSALRRAVSFASQQERQGCRADAGGGAPEELAPGCEKVTLDLRVHVVVTPC